MVAGTETGEHGVEPRARIELLEREGRFPELATELAALASHIQGTERAALLARLGEVRLRLDDVARALSAFRESLDEDPSQPVSRRWLEVMLAEPEHALEAAEVLEPIYESEFRKVQHSATMLLALLELRANKTSDPDERIALWARLGAYFDHAALPLERQNEISARMLRRTALEWPGGVAKWIERLMRAEDKAFRVEVLLSALDQPLADAGTILEIAFSAGEALDEAGRAEDALLCFERALSADPSAPEVVARVDALASRAGETIEQSEARYRAAIAAATNPARRAALMYALGVLLESTVGDEEAAIALWRQALSELPTLGRAHEALLAALEKQGDDAAIELELERALSHLSGAERRAALLKLGESLASRGEYRRALERCRELLVDASFDDPSLYLVERFAEEARDLSALRAVFDRRVEVAPDRLARARALEGFAEFQSDKLGDRAAAARSLKAAAELVLVNPDEAAEAERLYERTLELVPEDSEAALKLIELYESTDDWAKVPQAFHALLVGLPDAGDAVAPLLALEGRAAKAGAMSEFAAVAGEVLSRLGDSDVARARMLLAAKARLLAHAARLDEAADIYENLIEAFCDEEDVRAYVGLVESSPAAEWRHSKRRWLLEWRAGRADDPVAVLMHWAAVEEQEFSDVPAAVALLERAAKHDSRRPGVFQELSRLKLGSGDLAGGLDALSELRALGGGGDVSGVELSMAELLVERLDQPADAFPLLASVLARKPESGQARALVLGLCKKSGVWLEACDLLERAAESDAQPARRALFEALLEATEERLNSGLAPAELVQRRRRWFEGLLGSAEGEAALSVVERAAVEFPTEDAIWEAAEGLALRLGDAPAAVRAYERAIRRTRDAELAQALGRRLLSFADQHVGNPKLLSAALEALLELAPDARWAFERVKFALSSDQQWAALFPLYERVIAATLDESERARLLDEAAIAARDVAADPERAIGYWEQYFRIRPSDARVNLALERLYERQRKTADLITHLQKREGSLEGDDLTRLRERIAGLWVDLGDARAALSVIESLPKGTESRAEALELLERVFALAPPEEATGESSDAQRKVARKAAKLLKQRYTGVERSADVARVVLAELRTTNDRKERIKLLRQLAELRKGLADTASEFETLGELLLLEPHADSHLERLGELADGLDLRARLSELIIDAANGSEDRALFAKLLFNAAAVLLGLSERDRAIEIYNRVLDESERRDDMLEAARKLEQLLLLCGRAEQRCAVLERMAELEPELDGQKRAWLEAARVALEELAEATRSARAYRVLLDREPVDRDLHDGLVRSLRAAERWDELVIALEQRASLDAHSARAHRDLADVGRLQAEQLGDARSAITTWRTIRQRFGSDQESFDALAGLLERQEEWNDLALLLLEEATVARVKAPLYQRLAVVHRTRTLDLRAALEAYVKADDVLSAGELFTSHQELLSDDPALTLELSSKLELSGRVEESERVLRKQLDHYGPRRPDESVLVYLRLAELLRSIKKPEMALAELSSAAERNPSSAALQAALGEAAVESGDLARAEQSYRALLLLPGRSATALGRAEVYLRLSEISARREDAQSAEDHVSSAFEAALDSDEEAAGLERALKQRGRQNLLERAITSRLERTREPGKVLGALADLLDASTVFGETDPGVGERALRLADRAAKDLEASGAGVPEFRALVHVYDKLGQKERAVTTLERIAEQAPTAEERDTHVLEVARRLLVIPERRESALGRLWDLVRRDATNEAACELLLGESGEETALDELLRFIDDQLGVAETRGDSDRFETLSVRRANVLERVGRLPEALAAYRRLATSPPHRKKALREVVRLLEALDASKNELADAREALLEFDSGAEAAEQAARLAELRREQGDEVGLLRALERGFLADPTRSDLSKELRSLLSEKRSFEKLAEILERATQSAPEDGVLRLWLAQAYREFGATERALSTLDAALLANAPEGEVRRERAIVLESMGRHDDALVELDEANTKMGGLDDELLAAIERTDAWLASERWAFKAADLAGERGQRARARQMLEHWTEKHPDSVALFSRLGRLASLDRDFPVAIDAFRRLARLERGPAQRSAVLALARVCEAAGRPGDAVAEVERALAEGADTAELRRELAKLYAQSGAKAKQARLVLDEAAHANTPARADLLLKAAELFAAEPAWEEALTTLETLLREDSERNDAVALKALVLAGKQGNAQGRNFLEHYLSELPKRDERHARLYRTLAQLHLSEDELAEALAPLSQAHQLDKSDGEIAFTLGLVAFDLDQLDLAAASLRGFLATKESASAVGQLSKAYLVLACIEHAKGQRTVARRMASRALEVDAENEQARRLLGALS